MLVVEYTMIRAQSQPCVYGVRWYVKKGSNYLSWAFQRKGNLS